MAHFSGGSTTNFGGNSPSAPQANQWWVPRIYSKKVQIALRKAATAEAICNTDYMGEIKSFGDTVNIVIDPSYHRGQPHHRFHGLTGKVMKIQGKAYVIRTRVGNMDKDLIVRPEHLRKAN